MAGRQRQISRQVHGSRKQAERVETRLKAEVMAGRHRGTAAKTLGEMVEVYLDWHEQNDKPIGPRSIQGHRALAEVRIKPGKEQAREALQAAERRGPWAVPVLAAGGHDWLRSGEVCALWWQDFDLDVGELLVGYNVAHAKGLPDGYVRKRTKSRHDDDRPIALDSRTSATAQAPGPL